MLYGRAVEVAAIERLVAQARAGTGGAVVIRGEVGIGKTTLLHDALRTAGDMRVLRGAGYAAEAEQPFASLHLLLRSVRACADELPGPQAHALRAAFDSDSHGDEDRFQVRLAVLSLLSRLAMERPLLCLVDDAQWLDSASADTLMFAARRLEFERVAVVVAACDNSAFTATGLPEIRLCRLDRASTDAFVRARCAELAPTTREKIIAESGGNPQTVLELAASLTAGQRAGRFNPFAFHEGTLAINGTLQEEFRARLRRLPTTTQTLLLVAAADDTRDAGLVAFAADSLGVGPADLGHAERAELLQVDGTAVTFTHPSMRAVAYHNATTAEKRAAHRALAEAADDDHLELRAWQLAAATGERREEVAAELARTAGYAQGQRAYTAYARAAKHTPDRQVRAHRLTAAARAAMDTGLLVAAADLAGRAASLTDEPVTRAELAQIGAGVEFERGSPRAACRTMIDAAALITGHDPAEALLILACAIRYGWHGGDIDLLREAAAAVRAIPLPADSPLASLSPALCAIVSSMSDDPADGAEAISALTEVARTSLPAELGRRLMTSLIGLTAMTDRVHEVAADLVAEHRESGLAGHLPYALYILSQAQLYRGRHRDALDTAAEGLRLATETGQLHRASQLRCVLGWLAAVEGDEERCATLVGEGLAYALAHEIVPTLALGEWALALLDLGRGRNEAALTRLESIRRGGSRIVAVRRAPDQIEAAVRCGRQDGAARPLALLEVWVGRNPSPVGLAVVERCRALVACPEDAEQHYARAVRLHGKSDQPYERARTELAYGEWLRRARRRAEARPYLTAAAESFEGLGACPWAARAWAELEATGGTTCSRRPAPGSLNRLTPQELQVVLLAATGASNRDIAARLFLSPRTVGNHLYRAFPKLGIKTRAELGELDLGDPG